MKHILVLISLAFISHTLQAQSQMDMNRDAGNNYKTEADKLEAVYQQILLDYQEDTVFIQSFNISQNLWYEFRDAELVMKYPKREFGWYGSMHSMCKAGYLEYLTKERRVKLEEWLIPLEEGEGCGGSIKRRELEPRETIIEEVDDYYITELLNNIIILNEFKTNDLSVRIILKNNSPGSTRMENGEVTQDIYFVVSEFDEYPKQKLFIERDFYGLKIEDIDTSNSLKPRITISYIKSSQRHNTAYELSINEIERKTYKN